MSLISIITINYNNLEGLKKTVESVINQSWQNFEYIVIDGGSTDGSREYLENQNNKIDYWVSEPDKGIYNAMNKGIMKSKGEYLLFLNSGDHFFSNTVLYENYSEINNQDLIYFDILFVDEKSSKTISYPEKLSFSFFYTRTLCHQSTLIKKQLFNSVGLYDENLKFVSDWKFFIFSLYKFNCTYKKVSAIFTTYYLDGLSSNPENHLILHEERQQILKSEFKNFIEDFEQLHKLRAIVSNFKSSKKINWLIKLGLLNKF